MTPTGLEPLPPRGAFGPTSHQDAIAPSRSASARISTVPAIWSRGSSTRSNSAVGLQPATTSSGPTIERGMLISFDNEIRSWSASDLLLIETPSGQHLHFHPEKTNGDRLYVTAMIHPAVTLKFWL